MSDKVQVAKASAIAGGTLALFKVVVGILSGSLAVISEGVHSTLDFLVTVATWLSVKNADAPADREHHYGHGKIENLTAFAESILLLITALWISKEAYDHLTKHDPHVTVDTGHGWWAAVAVVSISLIVDFNRSRALHRAAKKHHSQALEADALHFGVELISSSAVLLGLLLVKLAGPRFWIADPIAALCVAAIMLTTGIRLARRSADVLVDRAPAGVEHDAQQLIASIPGVRSVPRLRARQSGARTFVDVTITVDPALDMAGGHEIADQVESRVKEKHPQLDIVVHVEPAPADEHATPPPELVRQLAEEMHLRLHAIRIRDFGGHLYVNFHVELPPDMPLAKAHACVTELEEAIRAQIPGVAEVLSHIEPAEK
jgi:cation diffusion facilitator family transporter